MIQRRRKRGTSLGWPLAKATIFRGSVTPKGKGEFGVVHGLEVWFIYSATGLPGVAQSEYQGVYREEFPYPQEAERVLESLKTGPFLVRYNPSSPAEYFTDPYRDVREPAPT